MGTKVFLGAAALAVAILLPACSTAPKTASKAETEAKQEPATAEPVTGRFAYWELRKPAQAWAPDLLSLTLKSGELPGVEVKDGKFPLWTAVFVTPSRKEARTFTYAVAKKGLEFSKGVNVSDKQTWAGATPSAKAFVSAEFAIDSDAAYKTAAEKAAGWLKKHPNAKYTMALGNTSRFPAPVWFIMWGTNKDGYAVYVNATTGSVVTR